MAKTITEIMIEMIEMIEMTEMIEMMEMIEIEANIKMIEDLDLKTKEDRAIIKKILKETMNQETKTETENDLEKKEDIPKIDKNTNKVIIGKTEIDSIHQ